jgi:hypothetical protein
MLRLVHPPSGGNGTDPPARRKGIRAPSLSLTADETRRVRAAIRNAARAYGSLECLAAAMGVRPGSLRNASSSKGRRPSVALAFGVARAIGVHVEAMLSGAMNEAGRCSTCGARAGAGRAAGGAS